MLSDHRGCQKTVSSKGEIEDLLERLQIKLWRCLLDVSTSSGKPLHENDLIADEDSVAKGVMSMAKFRPPLRTERDRFVELGGIIS